MSRTRFSNLAIFARALAIAAIGSWMMGCSKDESVNPLVPSHESQATPNGEFSIAWTGAGMPAAGGAIVLDQTQTPLGAEQMRDLRHALFNIQPDGLHGWKVAPITDTDGGTWLAVEPHPHGAARFLLSYDPATGLAEGSAPVSVQVPNAALNTVMKAFITRATGIANPLDVTVTKFEIADLAYAIHWTPDAKGMAPAGAIDPAVVANRVVVEAVFYVGETQGTLTASFDRLTGDTNGTLVAECPECSQDSPGPGGGGKPIGTNP